MSNLLEQLNPQQREAVEQTAGPLLILAGAGSGKTRVITFRIAYLIEVQQVPPERILAVTFTNKAADQMKERVAQLLEDRVELRPGAPHVSTFHSFCVSVLRRHIDRLGYTRDFSIYDADDQQRLVKAAIQELGLGEQMTSPRAALAQISYTKNKSLSPAELYERAPNPMTERLASLYDRYEAKLRKANALDFDDLLLKTVELFAKASDVREQFNERFRYILVDEYQDTNRVQYGLIRHLTAAHSNLCVVGDEDQSIYRWRGADIQNILSFQKDYPGARLVRLEQNYRSTQRILDAATAVVSRNVARIGKTLVTDRSGGEKIGLFEAMDAEEEALWVAETIARALAAGREQSVAVLYRTNAQSRVFEEALRRQGVEYRLVGGFSFYARAEIRDALAYARLAINRRDDASFLRILNTPPRGIGDTTREALEETAKQNKLTLWEALEHEMTERRLPARALRALESFHTLIEDLNRDRELLKLGEFLKSILERTRYLEILRQENLPESQDRIENLQELVNAAREAEERGITLAELLDHAALVSDQDDYDERARVTLMTLHSAKGLEFHVVFLAGLEEGLFPHQLSLDDEAGIEEERRLCYVGMTRAKDRLVLSWARTRRSYGREAFEGTRASRFLSEVPEALLERLNLTMTGAKPRTTWDNAFNSTSSVEEFFRRRNANTRGFDREPPAARPGRNDRWKLGAKVRHSKYGVGTVIDFEGEGEDTKLTVSFPGYGKKKLVERFAALEKV
ncbi:MAG: UvrD-helicase domain-containing protein [Acidobacteriia bacterium]|nr:UvrD-helicase domain-containing protein [Terriglobia bacterium]